MNIVTFCSIPSEIFASNVEYFVKYKTLFIILFCNTNTYTILRKHNKSFYLDIRTEPYTHSVKKVGRSKQRWVLSV